MKGYENRLNNVLLNDASSNYACVYDIVKSEILNVIQNFFIVNEDGLFLDIKADNLGKLIVKMQCETQGIKKLSKIN